MNGLSYLRNVVTLQLDREKCVACGTCEDVCPHDVFASMDGKSTICNSDACMECGACALNCAPGAIMVDSGVGCAAAVINAALGRSDACCCTE
ncbi:MAG: 4Fe-4S dicluster domain-containing protein [bacterium]|nr:4Fe-4S dicluster domain-containing protein [bacterium]